MTDNIQPLTVLACERFDNTIATAQGICRKIERDVAKNTESASVHFLSAVVGFSEYDYAS
ncbi:hypothetical protein AOQ84DRAFT_351474 [Glonium stellatum]|uniref:Uncharacterized protein n=1 Tax=Glonium stellatum TaxID=574774 RepID=A0A8E2FDQ0_9PEZI|nr:hypothetical protein AOQ84DRAFT_351474 [Glonium stellatum]